MAKRFSATEIWSEDWFLDIPNEYKLFWYYMLSTCDHAGMFKVNLRSFCSLLNVKINDHKALEYFNCGKDRIRVISSSLWFIEDFFSFQYGTVFNPNNKLHESILNIYNKHNINILEIRGLSEVKDRSKRPKEEGFDTLKDKVKVKVKDKCIEGGTGGWTFKPGEDNMGLVLPDIKIGATIELFKITKQADVTKEQIISLWEIFKKQNFDGEKFYQSESKVYSHFINWCKTQKIEKNGQGINKSVGKTLERDRP